ncbi:Uncharacterised protein [Burkholderia pseudomallei]|nr:hypothetical protein BTJ_1148 [Burkholderia thailandensis E444]AIC86344.1 hypothetical protein BTRA_2669 [Burkholderia thailandensis USAMRU Malaysia \
MLWDRGQLFVMHNQYALHVDQFILGKRPCLTTLGTCYTSIKYCLRSLI